MFWICSLNHLNGNADDSLLKGAYDVGDDYLIDISQGFFNMMMRPRPRPQRPRPQNNGEVILCHSMI